MKMKLLVGFMSFVFFFADVELSEASYIIEFEDLSTPPAIDWFASTYQANGGNNTYDGVEWDPRTFIVGKQYVEAYVPQGSNPFAMPHSGDYALINGNGENHIFLVTTEILTGAWFARVDLGAGAYGATQVTIHALNGTVSLGSESLDLNSTIPAFLDTSSFLSLTEITGYRIDRIPQESGEPSRIGSWTADDFQFGASPVPIPATAWLLGSGLVGLVGARTMRKKTKVGA